MEFRPGNVFIQQGDPKILTHRLIRLAQGSWWVHGFVAVTPTLAVEASLPALKDPSKKGLASWNLKNINSGGVRIINIQERLDWIKSYGGDVVIMDLPDITDEDRQKVADAALSFVGWKYGWLNCLFFLVFHIWLKTSRHELNCSFLMARAFADGFGKRIFDAISLKKLPAALFYRRKDLEHGLCTPDEVFRYSNLVEVARLKY